MTTICWPVVAAGVVLTITSAYFQKLLERVSTARK
jgi:hypothetical protein